MRENYFDIIEEFGTGDVLYFFYAQKDKKWGILDIDHEEIISCEHLNKPELIHFEEYFKLESFSMKMQTRFVQLNVLPQNLLIIEAKCVFVLLVSGCGSLIYCVAAVAKSFAFGTPN